MEKPIQWDGRRLLLLDQRKLPSEILYREYSDWKEVAKAISTMVVRGAPAIGITAAYGFILGCRDLKLHERDAALNEIRQGLLNTRPTAVNLAWALDRMHACAVRSLHTTDWFSSLEKEAIAIEDEDRQMCAQMSKHGADFLGTVKTLLTHCNTGALATGGDGTALGVIRELHRRSPLKRVYVDETRPYLQGSRLTAWELQQDKIPACLITDSMAAWAMRNDDVDAVIVGADRIALNGDVANKIGTYALALLCAAHEVPFLVVAPTSTFDSDCPNGNAIEIEFRPHDEIKKLGDIVIAPTDIPAVNPSFDITPNELITAIITEVGVVERGENQLLITHRDISRR